jgi:hypothetical protein
LTRCKTWRGRKSWWLAFNSSPVSVLAMALGGHSSAAVPRPAASSLMPLRCAHQAPELRSGMVGAQLWIAHHDHESWSMVYSAQRHQGGVAGHRPARGTAAELSTPSASSRTRLADEYTIGQLPYKTWASFLPRTDQEVTRFPRFSDPAAQNATIRGHERSIFFPGSGRADPTRRS